MSSQARPSFFCSRPNGTLTPLIAVDDLAPHVAIYGVPRTLTPGDTQGMTSCGVASPRTEPWMVEAVDSTSMLTVAGNDALKEVHAILTKTLADASINVYHRVNLQDALRRISEASMPTWDTATGFTSNNALEHPATASQHYANQGGNGHNNAHNNGPNNGHGTGHGKNSHASKKLYCSYWIRHGECDYQQQGCLFKHEMPTDPAMLEKLGLRDIPRWYREKYNVPSLLSGYPASRVQNTPAVDQPVMKALQYLRHDATPAPPVTSMNSISHVSQQRGFNGRNKHGRGSGLNGGKSRGNHGWNKNVHRNNMTPNGNGTSNGNRTATGNGGANGNSWPQNATPVTNSTPGLVDEASTKVQTVTSKFDLLTTEPAPDHSSGLTPQNIAEKDDNNKNGTKRALPLQCRLSNLTNKDAYQPVSSSDDGKNIFRYKSRFMFDFGDDGEDIELAQASTKTTDSPVSAVVSNATNDQDKPAGSLLSQLVAESDPIGPNETLFNFGAIGEPVVRPPSVMSVGGVSLLSFPTLFGPCEAKPAPAGTFFPAHGEYTQKPASQ